MIFSPPRNPDRSGSGNRCNRFLLVNYFLSRIQGHQRQLTTEERTFLKASIDNRYQERAVANGSLMMCEVQGAKEDFIRRWNSIFKEYPDVFEDSDCRKIIHDLTEDAVQYLLKIKEKTL